MSPALYPWAGRRGRRCDAAWEWHLTRRNPVGTAIRTDQWRNALVGTTPEPLSSAARENHGNARTSEEPRRNGTPRPGGPINPYPLTTCFRVEMGPCPVTHQPTGV
jgi:hypothetical protein